MIIKYDGVLASRATPPEYAYGLSRVFGRLELRGEPETKICP